MHIYTYIHINGFSFFMFLFCYLFFFLIFHCACILKPSWNSAFKFCVEDEQKYMKEGWNVYCIPYTNSKLCRRAFKKSMWASCLKAPAVRILFSFVPKRQYFPWLILLNICYLGKNSNLFVDKFLFQIKKSWGKIRKLF